METKALPPEVFNRFGQARVWVQLSGYLSLAYGAFALLLGFYALVTSRESSEVTATNFFVQIIIASMYLAPAILLLRYGHAMRGAARARSNVALMEALRMQHRYFHFVGMMVTVAICALVFMTVLVFAIPLAIKWLVP